MWELKDKYIGCCHNDACDSYDNCHECWDEWAEWNPPMTNADRIRAMSDEELAEVLINGDMPFCTVMETDCVYGWHTPHCKEHALQWLKQPVKEDA